MRTGFGRSRAAVTILLLVALLACTRERDAMARLQAEVNKLEERPTVARLSGFPHRPRPRQSRVAALPAQNSMILVRGAATDLVATHLGDPRSTAIARLLLGQRRQAAASLEALAEKASHDAAVWNDLAAARYELAAAEGDAGMYAAALAAADRALRIDPALPSALFNRALALAALSLDPAAARAFERYRAIDGTTGWSTEALEQWNGLQRPSLAVRWKTARAMLERGENVEAIAREFPQHARASAESDYLARWAEAFAGGDHSTALYWLRIARRVGTTRAQRFGDTLLIDTVRRIDAPAHRLTIAHAHLAYRRGRLMYATQTARVLEALPHLEEAERQFASAGSPMARVAGYYRANALVDAQQLELARDLIERIAAETPAAHRALHAQTEWLRSTIAGRAGQPYASLRAALAAAQEFRRIGEHEHAARMENAAATALRRLGRVRESRALRQRAFSTLSASGNASLWEAALNSAARDETLERRWDVAASFFAVESESESVSPRVRFDAALWGAVVEAKANGKSAPDLSAARTAAAEISDAAMREEVEVELDFVHGASSAHVDAERAVRLLSSVVAYRQRTSNFVRLSAAYMERAQAHLAAGRSRNAEDDLRAALAAEERVGGSIARDDLRDTFFGGIDEAYETLIEILVRAKRFDEAADVAERFRARGLAEADARRQNVALSMKDIASAIPPDTVLIHYSSTNAGTLVSVVRDRRVRSSILAASRSHIAERTTALLDAIQRDDASTHRLIARELHGLLIEPIAAHLERAETVVVVPDETLAAIPLAMLMTRGGRYLIEDHVLVHAASASMFVRHAHERSVTTSSRSRTAVIADPEIDATTFALDRLPAARHDAVRLASGRNAEVLTGGDATPSRVRAALAKSDLAHIATHAVTDGQDSWYSLIALASEPRSDGALYLHQIAAQDLRNLRMVTLAGCRTGILGGGRGSVRSLSRAFLAAGAHNVLATLWDVDDSATSKATQEFFRQRDQGRTAASALQQAQVTLLRSSDPAQASPKVWAALQLQGCNR